MYLIGRGVMDKKNKTGLIQEEIPHILPVIPTVDVVVFPQMVVPLLILDEKIIAGIEKALGTHKKVFLLAAQQQPSDYQNPISINDLFDVGTISNIMRVMHLPEGGIKLLTQGIIKASVQEILSDNQTLEARVEYVTNQGEEPNYNTELADKQIKKLLLVIEKIASSGRIFGPDFQVILAQIQDPERIADFILSHLNLNVNEAQMLLEKDNLNQMFDSIYEYLSKELELTGVEEKIKSNTRESINKSQKEFYLREQMKAIQKELGEEGDSDLSDLQRKINNKPLSQEAREEAIKQLKRLTKMIPESMEATVIRNHLEWLLNLPWGEFTDDNLDIKHAKKVLDDHHFGLDEVKDRILDFLSIKKLKNDCNVPILCFVGPPGVGKTSLGKSIADCLGRSYYRISLGGVYDESEIRGHRRTYVGALPGRFIQAIKKSKSMNPLIVIDEIDKIGSSNRGDPSAALLEVLDPEQNSTFYDNYLGVHFDLSKCIFVTTANDLSTISGPLRDRMEIIQLSGYLIDEKKEIAQKFLVPKTIKNSGLENQGVKFNEEVLEELISGYSRESGVRDLERLLNKLCSKYARNLVENNKKLSFTVKNLSDYLGPRKIPKESIFTADRLGVTNGLAWTPFGGEVLQVEAALMPGSGKLILTGQLGSVMQESAQTALTYAKSHANLFKIKDSMFKKHDLHIHLPAGAIPKDGPSAGITLLSSVLSVYTGRKINGTYAMTGELNLQGEVLPIGGLKEKILAAKQNGLTHVIVPKLNEKDLINLDKISQGLKILFVDNVQEVLDYVLLPNKPQQ